MNYATRRQRLFVRNKVQKTYMCHFTEIQYNFTLNYRMELSIIVITIITMTKVSLGVRKNLPCYNII